MVLKPRASGGSSSVSPLPSASAGAPAARVFFILRSAPRLRKIFWTRAAAVWRERRRNGFLNLFTIKQLRKLVWLLRALEHDSRTLDEKEEEEEEEEEE